MTQYLIQDTQSKAQSKVFKPFEIILAFWGKIMSIGCTHNNPVKHYHHAMLMRFRHVPCTISNQVNNYRNRLRQQ